MLSDWKNFSFDSRVLVAVTDVRGAGVGMVVVEVSRDAVGLETTDVSLAAGVITDVGWKEGEVENLLEVLDTGLGFSLSHVCPSLDCV